MRTRSSGTASCSARTTSRGRPGSPTPTTSRSSPGSIARSPRSTAAASVAAAARWPLQVFVPVDADPAVVARLKELHAIVTACPRDDGVPGDPTYHRLEQELRSGALPFTCQGSQNGLAIEGGLTLG